jgi:predicted solute-binding protein
MRGGTVAGELRGYVDDPIDGVRLAALRLADAETAENADRAYELLRERHRDSLRRYLWTYISKWVRRQPLSHSTKAEIARVLNSRRKRL